MKRYMMILLFAFVACISTFAMRYEDARREALYLTDKMAYELNLNQQQYDYAYEINLDYMLGLRSHHDLDGLCHRHRCADLRDILHDWQYGIFLATEYFLRPVLWRNSAWYFPIYVHYNRDHFYYHHPRVYHSYRGAHGRLNFSKGYYAGRRPAWNSGFRGNQIITSSRGNAARHDSRTVRGDGYSFQLPGRNGGNATAGNRMERSARQDHGSRLSVQNKEVVHVSKNAVDRPTRPKEFGDISFRGSSTRSTVNRPQNRNASSVGSAPRQDRSSSRGASVGSAPRQGRSSSASHSTRGGSPSRQGSSQQRGGRR